MTQTRSARLRRSFAGAGLALALSAVATACPPVDGGGGTGSTTSTTAPSGVETLNNVAFEWTVSEEANTGAFNGQCNFISAGKSDGSAADYAATNGDATVLKLNAANAYVPISDYATRCKDRNGVTVTATGPYRLGQKVRFTGGDGTYNPANGATTVQWTGTFTINFYGTLVPFWIVNPKLVVNANGTGQITATLGGYASDISDPNNRELLPDTANVVVANFSGIANDDVETFTATPAYAGVVYNSPNTPQNRVIAGWGSWPVSFASFQEQTGLGAYWYTSGSSADARKAPAPFAFDLNR